jgi:single-strand DNA-binding protein
MASLCKVQIIGNLGADPETRYTQSGTMTVRFNVAVNRRGRNPDGSPLEETEWFRVNAFGRLAETCQQYLTKGSPVFIDGRLRVDRWTGQDGQPRFTLDIVANDMVMVGSRPREEGFEAGEGAEAGPRPIRTPAAAEQNDLEDLPF